MSDNSLQLRQISRALKGILGYVVLPGDHDDLVEAAQAFDLKKRDAKKVASWFMAKFPERFDRKRRKVRGDLKCLIDENTSPLIIPDLRHYGHFSSVLYEGWRGVKDKALYPYAEERGFDCILTRDKAERADKESDPDLTNIALDIWRNTAQLQGVFARVSAPVLVRFPTVNPTYDGTFDVLYREFDFISHHVRARSHALIDVRPSGVSLVSRSSPLGLFEAARQKKHKTPAEAVKIPNKLARAVRVSRRLAVQRNVPISALLEDVKQQTARAYDHHMRNSGQIGVDDFFDILDSVLNRCCARGYRDGVLVIQRALETVDASFKRDVAFSTVPQTDLSAVPS